MIAECRTGHPAGRACLWPGGKRVENKLTNTKPLDPLSPFPAVGILAALLAPDCPPGAHRRESAE
jgi:hypothetical protein